MLFCSFQFPVICVRVPGSCVVVNWMCFQLSIRLPRDMYSLFLVICRIESFNVSSIGTSTGDSTSIGTGTSTIASISIIDKFNHFFGETYSTVPNANCARAAALLNFWRNLVVGECPCINRHGRVGHV